MTSEQRTEIVRLVREYRTAVDHYRTAAHGLARIATREDDTIFNEAYRACEHAHAKTEEARKRLRLFRIRTRLIMP